MLSAASRTLRPRPWLTISQRKIPTELIVTRDTVRFTHTLLTALDLAPETNGASIDDALRNGAKLEHLHWALNLLHHRKSLPETRRLLHEARDEPWSPAERKAHILLRQAKITGWKSNLPVRNTWGSLIGYIDIGFQAIKLGLEIDGARWHLHPEQVIRDRLRDQQLAEAGWTVVRIGAAQLDTPAEFIHLVKGLLATRRQTI